MKQSVIKVHPEDDMLVALRDLKKNEKVEYEGTTYELITDVPNKHKFAGKDFDKGSYLRMYGVIVGKTTQPVKKGEVLTTENLTHAASEYSDEQQDYQWTAPDVSDFENRTFMGFHRPDGSVGTANYWLFIPTVFCENRNMDVIRESLVNELGYGRTQKYKDYTRQIVDLYKKGKVKKDFANLEVETFEEDTSNRERLFPNVDGVKFLTHEGGCGGTRQDSGALAGLLAGYITHSNVAGVTVLSLGCQHLQIQELKDEIYKRDPDFSKPIHIYEQQQEESEEQLIKDAIKSTFAGLIEANKLERKPAPLNKLIMGLECGGSDGFSGISANPSVGYASDMLVALGGSAILSEFPELCGVEQDLTNRCINQQLAEKFVSIMRNYDSKAKSLGSGFDMNPSPGNIKDGLITDAIKSAGAAKKGGTSPVTDVLDFTEPVTQPGLNLLCTPGNDVESTTGLAGSGANIILFTTGLGTPTGNPVAPVIKLSSNSALAQKMPEVIDIDTGSIITGDDTIESMGRKILDLVIKVASGEVKTKADQLGQDDFIPWKRGISL